MAEKNTKRQAANWAGAPCMQAKIPDRLSQLGSDGIRPATFRSTTYPFRNALLSTLLSTLQITRTIQVYCQKSYVRKVQICAFISSDWSISVVWTCVAARHGCASARHGWASDYSTHQPLQFWLAAQYSLRLDLTVII